MRKRLIVTAAVLVAVIFFSSCPPPRPRIVPIADAALAQRTVAGAYHIHSVRSDGSGDRQAIAAAAARAGLKFVILTDHGDGTRVRMCRHTSPACCASTRSKSARRAATTPRWDSTRTLSARRRTSRRRRRCLAARRVRLAAHPDRAGRVRRSDWTGIEGIEWMNADSEWRNETRVRLARVVLTTSCGPARRSPPSSN